MLKRRRAAVLCVSIFGLLGLQAYLHAQEPPAKATIAAGIRETRARDFVNALVTLNDVVTQLDTRLEDAATLARAHAYRAAAFIGLEQPEWAKAAVLLSLKADPAIVIDATEFGPRVAALFEAARRPARDPEAAGQAAEAAGRFQDAFLAYLSAIQSLAEPPPAADDQRLREKIIKVVHKLEPKPTVPEEARTRLAKATALLETDPAGASEGAATQAATELRKAVRIAPWWPDAMVKLATTLQRSGRFDEALINLGLYEAADPAGYAAISGGGGAGASRVEKPAPAAAPAPPAAAEPAANAPAMIYVYFPRAARGIGVNSKITCDGERMADLGNGRYIVLKAAPGFHNFEFKRQKAAGSFEGGANHYIRVGIEGYPAHFVLRVTSPEQAVAEMRDKSVMASDPANIFSTECKSVAATPARKRF